MDGRIILALDPVVGRGSTCEVLASLGIAGMKKRTTFGLKPRQLGRLLAVSAHPIESADAMAEDNAKETLLQKYLARRLFDEPSYEKVLLAAASRSAEEVRPLLARSLRETLLDPQCDLDVLRAIKDHSKKRSAMVTSGSETLITSTVYYAAIAAALVHHGQRISKYSHEDLGERLSLLSERPWIDHELQDLFTRAVAVCRQARINRQ